MNKVLVVFYSNVTKTFSFLRFAVTNKLSTTKYQSFIFNVTKNICFLGITLLDQLEWVSQVEISHLFSHN